ncbi:nitroreductase family protein [Lysinibacter sp. HNR]|uniref:nitroreductase family protein n=1 Tax=Lysinibacter sp. HNR TaxID=3031408 RepID=UPI002435AF4A|nr:nitroreductase family protein [Lysinibacter sp. HNR]WGD37001.1 nitroreductase family protein [Lysinibacter sp. HNR]
MSKIYDAFRNRRSLSKVTAETPSTEDLLHIIEAAGRIPDHSSLHPWRVIEIRGSGRAQVGQALAQAEAKPDSTNKYVQKAQRAELLLAVVFSPRASKKVPEWEQEAVAAGIAHSLVILLEDAGWGVIWRTGHNVRTQPVHQAHRLAPEEKLMGWLYVGGRTDAHPEPRKSINPREFLSEL